MGELDWMREDALRQAAETLTALRDAYAELDDHVATGVLNAARELLFRAERRESPWSVPAELPRSA